MPMPFALQYAIDSIAKEYGKVVDIETKDKSLLKFGKNSSLSTTEQMVWLAGGIEVLADGNDIVTARSDNPGDTQDVTIEGHTLDPDGLGLTFVTQPLTLEGTGDVSLATPLHRATRIFNNDSTDFAGTVDVVESDNTVHLQTEGGNNQSLKCATSLSKNDFWILTHLTASVNRQNARSVDFKLQWREFGKVFRTRFPFSCHSNSGTIPIPLGEPYLIIPANADMRVLATSSGTSTGVEVTINGYLAVVTGDA